MYGLIVFKYSWDSIGLCWNRTNILKNLQQFTKNLFGSSARILGGIRVESVKNTLNPSSSSDF